MCKCLEDCLQRQAKINQLYLKEIQDAVWACNVIGPLVFIFFLYFDIYYTSSDTRVPVIIIRLSGVPLFWIFTYFFQQAKD